MVALTCSNGVENDVMTEVQYQQIVDTIEWEKNAGETLTWKETVRTPSARRRVLLVISVATFTVIAGNVIASYYLGSMLNHAGEVSNVLFLSLALLANRNMQE